MARTPPEMDWSGGAVRRSGGEFAVKTAMAFWQRPPRLSTRIGTRGALMTYWDDPELRRPPEVSRRRWRAAAEQNYKILRLRSYGYARSELARA